MYCIVLYCIAVGADSAGVVDGVIVFGIDQVYDGDATGEDNRKDGEKDDHDNGEDDGKKDRDDNGENGCDNRARS